MMTGCSKAATLTGLVLAATCGGCSFVFSKPPPGGAERGRARPHFECTTSYVAPIVDTGFGTYQIIRSGFAATANDSAYRDSPISREADLALGLGFTALFVGSAIYGYSAATRCQRVKQGELDDHDATGSPPPRGAPTTGPRPPAPGPAPVVPPVSPVIAPTSPDVPPSTAPSAPPEGAAPASSLAPPAPVAAPSPPSAAPGGAPAPSARPPGASAAP